MLSEGDLFCTRPWCECIESLLRPYSLTPGSEQLAGLLCEGKRHENNQVICDDNESHAAGEASRTLTTPTPQHLLKKNNL